MSMRHINSLFAPGEISINAADFGLGDGTIELERLGAAGDFNVDASVDADDIDLLFEAITGQSHHPRFDLVADQMLEAADADHLVRVILATEFGDSNLDGNVDAVDLAIVRNNFGGIGGWVSADFTGDLSIDAADLAIVRNNFGFSGLASPAPEGHALLLMGLAGLLASTRRRR